MDYLTTFKHKHQYTLTHRKIYDLFLDGDHEPVAFTAFANETRSYASNSLVIFDGIVSNVGNHYSTDTSIFTCPYNGLFLFSLSFNAYDKDDMEAEIMLENEGLVMVLANSNGFSQASGIVLTECNVGDIIWVRCVRGGDSMYGNQTYRWSHISGTIIQAYV